MSRVAATLLPRCCRSNRLREPREISISGAREVRGTASVSASLIGGSPRRATVERRGEDGSVGLETYIAIYEGRSREDRTLDGFNKRK